MPQIDTSSPRSPDDAGSDLFSPSTQPELNIPLSPRFSSLRELPVNVPAGHKNLYLIRHGETELNRLGYMQGGGVNIKLNERGQRQAELLSQSLRSTPLDVIVASPLTRAVETARKVRFPHHAEAAYVEDERFVEMHWGVYEGREANAEIAALKLRWDNGDFDAKFDGGESPNEAAARVVPAVWEILQKPEYTNIGVVMHGRLMRVILASLMHNSLQTMEVFTHHNTCVSVLQINMQSRAATALVLDDFTHLLDTGEIGTASPGLIDHKINGQG